MKFNNKLTRIISKSFGLLTLVCLMTANIQFSLADNTSNSIKNISIAGIEIELVRSAKAEPGCTLPCYWDDYNDCLTIGMGLQCIGTYGCPAKLKCRYEIK